MNNSNRNSVLPKVTPHYLQSSIRKRQIPLWQLRLALGNSMSEAKLSRILNGIEPMPPELEKKIKRILER